MMLTIRLIYFFNIVLHIGTNYEYKLHINTIIYSMFHFLASLFRFCWSVSWSRSGCKLCEFWFFPVWFPDDEFWYRTSSLVYNKPKWRLFSHHPAICISSQQHWVQGFKSWDISNGLLTGRIIMECLSRSEKICEQRGKFNMERPPFLFSKSALIAI